MNHHSHKHIHGTPPQQHEGEIRDLMAQVFKQQKAYVVESLPAIIKSPKKAILDDTWDKHIVDVVDKSIRAIFQAGGEKALRSIKKFPKATGKKGYTADEVAASVDVGLPRCPTNETIGKGGAISGKARIELPEWLDDPDVIAALEAEEFKFAKNINENTADALREELIEGMESGESIDTLTERIESIFEDWEGYRAERIARTESARAYSDGHIAAWKSTGVVQNKVWVAAADACPFCLDMNGTVVDLDETFMDKGEDQDIEWGGKDMTMSQEYDDVNGPPLHPNCRCALVGELKDTEQSAEGDKAEDGEEKSIKGESAGHEFRGNQYTTGGSAGDPGRSQVAIPGLGAREVVLSARSKNNGDKLVNINVARFDNAWAQDKDMYVGPGGTANAIGNRYSRVIDFIKDSKTAIEASEVAFNAQGKPTFINGRHRYAAMRDMGVTHIPMAVTQESLDHVGHLAGSEEQKGIQQIMKTIKGAVATTKFEAGAENNQMVEISFALAALIQGMNVLAKKLDDQRSTVKYVIVRDKDGLISEVQEQTTKEN